MPDDPSGDSHVSLPTGDATTRYESGRVLGAGGMGEVRLQHDGWIGRDVAVKRMHHGASAPQHTQARFLREARVQGQIEHPSVVPVYDVGVGIDGGMYFTMRRVRGRTLQEILEAIDEGDAATIQQFSRRKLLNAFVNVCLAVHYAHTRGVIHRDLKPSNIMLGDFGEVYVLDWGVARITGVAEVTDGSAASDVGALTQAGALVGTPAYMSPEQARGLNDKIDGRSDVYALGLILYETLTYSPFHLGSTTPEIFSKTLEGIAMRPALEGKDAPPELTDLCVRATTNDLALRIASARELADAVERFLDGDRDLERRRALALEKAERAELATEKALAHDSTPAESQEQRVAAMRGVMESLALDPQQPAARKSLVRLLVEHGDAMPPEAQEEMAASEREAQREGIRSGFWVHLSWLACIPVVYLMGVRSHTAIAVTSLLTVAAVVLTAAFRNAQVVRPWYGYALAIAHFATVVSISHWVGPFVYVPCAVAVGTLVFALQCSRSERIAYVALGGIAAAVPFVLEWLHIVPAGYRVYPDHIVIFARSIRFGSGMTVGALFYLGLMYATIPSWYFGRIRDKLSRAERELFLHAWHLKRLVASTSAAPDT